MLKCRYDEYIPENPKIPPHWEIGENWAFSILEFCQNCQSRVSNRWGWKRHSIQSHARGADKVLCRGMRFNTDQ